MHPNVLFMIIILIRTITCLHVSLIDPEYLELGLIGSMQNANYLPCRFNRLIKLLWIYQPLSYTTNINAFILSAKEVSQSHAHSQKLQIASLVHQTFQRKQLI